MQYQLSAVSPDEKQQVMYYCLGMGKCLLNLGRNQEALEQYETWHSMYKKQKAGLSQNERSNLTECNENYVCPPLANLYFEAGNLAKARKYAEEANSTKVKGLLEKLDEAEKSQPSMPVVHLEEEDRKSVV